MSVFKGALSTVRYFRDVASFLSKTLTAEDARRTIESQFANRDNAFLEILETAVYADPRSPYLRLLINAGITLEELRRLVRETGLEVTLGRLHDAGVYVTEDEFKGRQPIKRGSLEFTVRPSDFNNPLLDDSTGVKRLSSGSTGRPTHVNVPLKSVEYRAAETLFIENLYAGDRPLGVWKETSILSMLRFAKIGQSPEKLFTTVGFRRSWEGLRYAILLRLTVLGTRIAGQPVPMPEVVTNDSAVIIARWLAQKAAAGTPATLSCHPSQAISVCLAARDQGLDIQRTLFQMGGEPFTPTRAEILTSVGASGVVRYGTTETRMLGFSCGTPDAVDDVHLLMPKIALICRDHEVQDEDPVNALILTNLLTSSPKVILNLYVGDYATVTQRECGCPLGAMGFTTHISGIRSYEKLTSGGVTFIGSQLYDLIEQVLPQRFCGRLNDYQLVEEEDEQGSPRVSIVVAPGVGSVDEKAVIDTVLQGLEQRHAGFGGDLMTVQWRQANTLSVVKRQPYQTRSGKVLPLYFLSRAGSGAAAEEDT